MTLATLGKEIVQCRRCPRLVTWREEVAAKKRRAYQEWTYWGKPVPGFGDPQAQVLVVGLAPGAHGSNRTGRMFTGDASGEFLYAALHRAGLANQPTSTHREDGLRLTSIFITAVCRCVPPDNKPHPQEIKSCLPYLQMEINYLEEIQGVVALGRIAFEQVIRLYLGGRTPHQEFVFRHAGRYELGDGLPWLIASYHPSRQNTQTGRLTSTMFDEVWSEAQKALG
jgi:uracil-DNA glycosylase family 4